MNTTGINNQLTSPSQYNRCWKVNSSFAEALELLLFTRFIQESNIDLSDVFICDKVSEAIQCHGRPVFSDSATASLCTRYSVFKGDVKEGKFGVSPQFCIVNYLVILDILLNLHHSIQIGNFDLRLDSWRMAISYFFSLNQTNYSRYGSLYVQ